MVAVTGMAWATPLGSDLTQTWQGLLAGGCGLTDIASPHVLRSDRAGIVPGVDYHSHSPSARMEVFTRQGVSAALSDAGLSVPRRAHSWQVVLGTSLGASADEDVSLAGWAIAACADMGLPEPIVLSTACSSGADAIAVAADLIRSGGADVCVCGGVDVVTEAKRLGHSVLGTMSPTGLRAFDVTADGMELGEGYGIMVLESSSHSRARGRSSYGRHLGSGSSNDATGLTEPDSSGAKAVRAIESALHDAQLSQQDVSLVSAHATGTPINDALEARALSEVFSHEAPPVVMATKGALGHGLGATGAIEAIALLQALRSGRVPPVLGLRDIRPDLRLPVPQQPHSLGDGRIGVSLSLGFGGFNTCLVLQGTPC